jgi:hypothetical protein
MKESDLKVIIAGGRDFSDYDLLCKRCDKLLSGRNILEIVSGGARGADSLGERYAKEKQIPIKKFPAEWDKWGKSAGYRRNAEMARYADILIAFHDGESRGTNHMINLARDKNLEVHVIRYKKITESKDEN